MVLVNSVDLMFLFIFNVICVITNGFDSSWFGLLLWFLVVVCGLLVERIFGFVCSGCRLVLVGWP